MPEGPEDAPEALAALEAMGFRDAASALGMLRGWQQGRVRATRSERARALLAGMLPGLLESFAAEAEPDAVLARFDAMLSHLPVGVQILSMIQRNPALLRRIATILGAAPRFADHLAHFPAAFEGLLSSDPTAPLPMLARVREARHLEEALDAARRLATERRFEIDAALLEGRLSADEAGLLRSNLAEDVMEAVIPRVAAEFAIRHGKLAGGVLAVLAEKDASGLLRELADSFEQVVITRSSSPRAIAPEELAVLAASVYGEQNVKIAQDARQAMAMANELRTENAAIVVAGSISLVGDVLALIQEEAI
jgi:glutamine synthetase adenylyltransferase